MCYKNYIYFSFLSYYSFCLGTNGSHIAPCGKTNLTDRSGIIKSPNYPNAFLNGQIKCEWLIICPPHTVLILEILDLDLDKDCSGHWLSVPNEGGRGSNIFCGRESLTKPIHVVQLQNEIQYYSSEQKKTSRGFTIRYSIEKSACDASQWHCNDGGCVGKEQICDGVNHCIDKSDESRCPAIHGFKYTNCPLGTASCPSAPTLCYSLLDQTCDGKFTCPGGEDELNCGKKSFPL